MHDQSSKLRLIEYLRKHHLVTLSTVSLYNLAHSATMYAVCDDNFDIYFITKDRTIKVRNLEANPSASICVADEKDLSTLQISGNATALEEGSDAKYVYDLFKELREKIEHFALPISKIDAGAYKIFKFTVDSAVLTTYSDADSTEEISKISFYA